MIRFVFWKGWLLSTEKIVRGDERNQGEHLGAVAVSQTRADDDLEQGGGSV